MYTFDMWNSSSKWKSVINCLLSFCKNLLKTPFVVHILSGVLPVHWQLNGTEHRCQFSQESSFEKVLYKNNPFSPYSILIPTDSPPMVSPIEPKTITKPLIHIPQKKLSEKPKMKAILISCKIPFSPSIPIFKFPPHLFSSSPYHQTCILLIWNNRL